jgi:hypothetical protein
VHRQQPFDAAGDGPVYDNVLMNAGSHRLRRAVVAKQLRLMQQLGAAHQPSYCKQPAASGKGSEPAAVD